MPCIFIATILRPLLPPSTRLELRLQLLNHPWLDPMFFWFDVVCTPFVRHVIGYRAWLTLCSSSKSLVGALQVAFTSVAFAASDTTSGTSAYVRYVGYVRMRGRSRQIRRLRSVALGCVVGRVSYVGLRQLRRRLRQLRRLHLDALVYVRCIGCIGYASYVGNVGYYTSCTCLHKDAVLCCMLYLHH